MNHGDSVTGRQNQCLASRAFLSLSNDSAVHDSASIHPRLTQAINEARDRGDIELLELIAKDPQAFIRQQGWASVSLDPEHGLMELRSLYEHLQARILEMIEPSSMALRRAEDAPETVCGETPITVIVAVSNKKI